MSKWTKMKGLLKLGGIQLLLLKLGDKLTGSSNVKAFLYNLQETSKPEDYRKLLENYYQYRTGNKLDLDHPQTFNEKIQWMKIYDSTPEKTRLADKYLVRDWVKEKIGEEYLIPILGVWDSFDEIDFNALPDQFVLKCNHGSGMNFVVNKKDKMDIEKWREQFSIWMKKNFAYLNFLELQYRDIPRKIIAEEYIEQMDGGLLDYKIHVFGGEPKIIQVIGNRDLRKHTAKECFFTVDWQMEELMYHTYDLYDTPPSKPNNIDRILEIAKVLGEGFKYARVDLYDLDGNIKFGEMTFTPASGFGKWGQESIQSLVGSWIKL